MVERELGPKYKSFFMLHINISLSWINGREFSSQSGYMVAVNWGASKIHTSAINNSKKTENNSLLAGRRNA